MALHKKKSQVAVESIMVYALVILAAMTTIGVLNYFGVLDFASLSPDICEIKGIALNCEQYSVTSDKVSLELRNNIGRNIDVTSIEIYGEPGTDMEGMWSSLDSCKGAFSGHDARIRNGEIKKFDLKTGCDITIPAGKKIDGIIKLNFTMVDSEVSLTKLGDVRTSVMTKIVYCDYYCREDTPYTLYERNLKPDDIYTCSEPSPQLCETKSCIEEDSCEATNILSIYPDACDKLCIEAGTPDDGVNAECGCACLPTKYICDSETHTESQEISCGGTAYYCSFDETWQWRILLPFCSTDQCTSTLDQGETIVTSGAAYCQGGYCVTCNPNYEWSNTENNCITNCGAVRLCEMGPVSYCGDNDEICPSDYGADCSTDAVCKDIDCLFNGISGIEPTIVTDTLALHEGENHFIPTINLGYAYDFFKIPGLVEIYHLNKVNGETEEGAAYLADLDMFFGDNFEIKQGELYMFRLQQLSEVTFLLPHATDTLNLHTGINMFIPTRSLGYAYDLLDYPGIAEVQHWNNVVKLFEGASYFADFDMVFGDNFEIIEGEVYTIKAIRDFNLLLSVTDTLNLHTGLNIFMSPKYLGYSYDFFDVLPKKDTDIFPWNKETHAFGDGTAYLADLDMVFGDNFEIKQGEIYSVTMKQDYELDLTDSLCHGTDNDNDRYSTSISDAGKTCCMGNTQTCLSGYDCDDNPEACGASCYPGALEVCDIYDNNCDGQTTYEIILPTIQKNDGEICSSDAECLSANCAGPPNLHCAAPEYECYFTVPEGPKKIGEPIGYEDICSSSDSPWYTHCDQTKSCQTIGAAKCSYNNGWLWLASQPEICNDGFDNDCDTESDYDSADGRHGDNDCKVEVISASASNSNPVENTNIDVYCSTNPGNVNSVKAFIGTTQCDGDSPGSGWSLGTYTFKNCPVGIVGTKTVTCAIDTLKSYKSGTDQTTSIIVKSAKKSKGEACSASTPTDCQSGFCVDGVCCNSACPGTCQTCNLAGSLGTCANIPSGSPPKTTGGCDTYTCSDYVYGWDATYPWMCFAFSSSLANNGMCNGAGSCNTAATACTGKGAYLEACSSDKACAKSCPAGSLKTSYDERSEICYTDSQQHGCPECKGCDTNGACNANLPDGTSCGGGTGKCSGGICVGMGCDADTATTNINPYYGEFLSGGATGMQKCTKWHTSCIENRAYGEAACTTGFHMCTLAEYGQADPGSSKCWLSGPYGVCYGAWSNDPYGNNCFRIYENCGGLCPYTNNQQQMLVKYCNNLQQIDVGYCDQGCTAIKCALCCPNPYTKCNTPLVSGKRCGGSGGISGYGITTEAECRKFCELKGATCCVLEPGSKCVAVPDTYIHDNEGYASALCS